MQVNIKDVASGAFFATLGIAYFTMAATGLTIGSALNMGPGYFPIVLSGLLVLFGLIIAGRGLTRSALTPFGKIPWRAVILLSLATVIFATFFDELGLFPGVFVVAFLAALSTPLNPVPKAVLIAAGVAAFCTLVFGYGIRLPVAIIGPLFTFLGA